MRAGIQTLRTSHESGPGNNTNSPPPNFFPRFCRVGVRLSPGLCNGNFVCVVFVFFCLFSLIVPKSFMCRRGAAGKGREEGVGIKAGWKSNSRRREGRERWGRRVGEGVDGSDDASLCVFFF